MMRRLRHSKNVKSAAKHGFSLAELLIAAAILAITISGILIAYLRSLELNEIARNSSLAVQAARSHLERMKSTDYADVKNDFDQVVFGVADLDGMGVSYVDDSNPMSLEVTVSVSWRQASGRIYGEDTNLNGVINGGEDNNANGMLDSPVQLVSTIFNR